jgi:hypothetical protein
MAKIAETRNAYRISVKKILLKCPLGKEDREGNNIKMYRRSRL